jgi:tricorn protease
MLINPWSGSGGDLFPWYFKKTGLGPLIGTTTWGGLIGISGSPGLIDGGFLTVPTFGIYTVDGKWVVENEGVAPDIEVVDDPGKMLDGGDPQLERAIAEVLKSLETKKPAQPRPPAYPNRSGR